MNTLKNLRYIAISFHCSRPLTAGLLLLRTAQAALPVLQTLAIAGLLDVLPGVISAQSLSAAFFPLAGLFAVLMAGYLLQAAARLAELSFNMRLENKLKPQLVTKLNRLSYEHIENDETYDLLERVGEDLPGSIERGFTNLLDLAAIILSVLGLIAIIGHSSVPAAVACLLLAFPVVMIAKKSGTEAYEAGAQIAPHARKAKYFRSLLSSREAASERTLFGFGDRIGKFWGEETDRRIELDFKADRKIFLRSKSVSAVFTLLLVAVSLLLLLLVKENRMTAGVFISLVISLSALIHTLSWQLSGLLKDYTGNRLYLEDLECAQRLSEVPGSDLAPDERICGMPLESLVFDRVSFKYPGSEREILRDFSLTILPGKQYAFVGRNGCGKSTVIKLLTGLYRNYTGRILLNNRDINSFTAAERKAYFSVLYQEYAKYQLTVTEQLRLGNPALPAGKIDALLEQMGLAVKVRSFPKGADTALGKLEPDSTDLSGGQWQLLALARSFGREARLFVFDEPAAALDVLAENNLYETVRRSGLNGRMTTLYITHRLAAARLADEIIVMNEGRIIEQGPHDILLARNGYYAEMFTAQAKWYKEHREVPA